MASPEPTTRMLRPEHHVARYCRPRTVTNGIISREAFLLREGEQFLSANWLEHFHESDRQIQVSGVRASLAGKNFDVNPNGRFAVLNVEVSDNRVRQIHGVRLLFQLLRQASDPSHTGVFGYGPPSVDPKGYDIAQSLAESVQEEYPAIL